MEIPLIALRGRGLRGRPMLVAALACLALVAAACGGADDPAPAGGEGADATAAESAGRYPLTLVDESGTEVTIARRPERVITVLPAATNYLVDLDLASLIVGTDEFSLVQHGADGSGVLAGVPSIGGTGFSFNLEAATALEPDLVLSPAGFSAGEFAEQLRAVGITVVVLEFPATVEQMLMQALLVGRVLGAPDVAEAWVADMRERIAAATAQAPEGAPLRVYLELDQSTPTRPFSVGPGSLHDEVIRLAGGVNVFDDVSNPFPQVNWEAVITANPDVIFLLDSLEFATDPGLNPVSVEEVGARTGWSEIRAVQTGAVVALDPNLFTTGERLITMIERMAEALAEVRAAALSPAGANGG